MIGDDTSYGIGCVTGTLIGSNGATALYTIVVLLMYL